MSFSLQKRVVIACLFAFFAVALCQIASADEDMVHVISGVVKHVDKDSKTMVVKTADGTEHTVKWTGKTTWESGKETGKGVKEGSQVSVKYTEKAGEKTAVGVKDLGKDAGKAAQ
ncbi:MAG TPA: hypothetical protein VEI52_11060 [Terriglobales bacterium]|nr:hypothetical protein [Terriglobales bacterium]